MTSDTGVADRVAPARNTGRPGVALLVVAVSTFLSMSVWFSASFVAPQLVELWGLSPAGSSLLTIAVQLGFVVGAVASAATGLADAVSPRKLMCAGAIGAAVANVLLLWADGLATALPLRLLTGVFLASIYPPALKEVSTWFRSGRGTALGVMIGALTLGSALPHLVRSFGEVGWQSVIIATSIMTAAGGLLVLCLRGSGPYPFPRRPFSVGAALSSLRNRNVALANVGYVGHMWELYAMWAWVGAFLAAVPAVAASAHAQSTASALAFLCIGAGALGCLVGGRLSDRFGRAQSALTALVCSGCAALALSLVGTGSLTLVVPLCVFWGFWVIADSAQFSALVTEHADPVYVGGAVSIQLALGYCTTAASLWLVPTLVQHFSWSVALLALAVGPALGAVAMVALIRSQRDGRVVKDEGAAMHTVSGWTPPAIGATAEMARTVGVDDIAKFTDLSGDRNPLHYDEEVARSSRFGEIIVQGGVTSAILNAVVAEKLPGPGTVFLGVNWSFLAPVRPGDTITGRVEVIAARADKPITDLKTTVTRGDGTVVLDGTAVCYTAHLAGGR